MRKRFVGGVTAGLLLLAAAPALAGISLRINEVRTDQSGSDTEEYLELYTTDAGASLTGFSIVVVGDGSGGSGTIEKVWSLDGLSFGDDGFFVLAGSTLTLGEADLVDTAGNLFENSDNLTIFVVSGFRRGPRRPRLRR